MVQAIQVLRFHLLELEKVSIHIGLFYKIGQGYVQYSGLPTTKT